MHDGIRVNHAALIQGAGAMRQGVTDINNRLNQLEGEHKLLFWVDIEAYQAIPISDEEDAGGSLHETLVPCHNDPVNLIANTN